MLGKGAKDAFIANTAYNEVATRVKVYVANGNERYNYPGAKELNFKFTNGLYQMKYNPIGNTYGDYVLCCDMFPKDRLRLTSYDNLKERAEKDELINFVYKYTNLSPLAFKMAKANNPEGKLKGNKITPIPIALDINKYYKDHGKQLDCLRAPGWLE